MGAARNLEQDQAAFEDKQLKSLDGISAVSPSEVLDKAVEINIIDEATKVAIKKAMPGYEAIFQKALEKAGTGPAAFKKAFKIVYGRFLMERGGSKYKLKVVKEDGSIVDKEEDLEDPKGPLMQRLGKVLKFPIEDGLGLKGRTELTAAVGRLRLMGLETNLGKEELENVAKLKSKEEADTVLQDKVNFLTTENSKLAGIKKMSAEIYGINPVGPDADTISDRFINEVEPLVNSLDSLRASDLAQKYAVCVKGVAAVQRNIDRPNSPGAIQMALGILLGNLRALNIEIESEISKGNTELAANRAEIGKIEKSTKGTLTAKVIGKIDKEIEQIDKDLAGAGDDKKKSDELELRKTTLVAQRANPVLWITEKAFGKTVDAAELKRLERDVHDKAHKKAALEESHKYFSGDDVKELQKKYQGIEGSAATAANVRSNKTKLDLRNEDKTKLEELKKLFSEDKTTELQDKFLKLQGLWSHYSTAPDNLDKIITDKSAELDLVKSTIDNYEKSGRQFHVDTINKKNERLAQLQSNLSLAKAESGLSKMDKKLKIAGIESEIKDVDSFIEKAKSQLGSDDGNDRTNRAKLITIKGEIAESERAKAKRDEFKSLLHGFRTDVLSYTRALEKANGLGMFSDSNTAKVKDLKDFFDKLNSDVKIETVPFETLQRNYSELKDNFADILKAVNQELRNPEFGINEKQALEDDQSKIEKAKAFHAELKPVVEKILKANKLGVRFRKGIVKNKIGFTIGKPLPRETQEEADRRANSELIEGMETAFKAIKPDDKDFSAKLVAAFYKDHIEGLLGDGDVMASLLKEIEAVMIRAEDDAKAAEKSLKKIKDGAEKLKDLTDDQAAKKIIGTMVALEFPDLSPMEHNKLVTMILADDVATLQTDEGYEALAQRGSAEKLETLKFAGFRAKLLNFKFKEGDKVTQPFKGLKPDDFKDWASMEKLFLSGKLNYKNAFFVLAAFEDFDNGVKSIQSVQLEKKLKKLLAKQMGVDEHMDKAGLSKIVDDAFKAQMEKMRPLMKAHSETVDSKGGKAKEHKKQVLDMKYEDLNDQLRTEKISQKVYEHKLEALVKEASESDVEVEFSSDSVGAQFWNSPQAQWLRDKGHDTGAFLGKKALAVGVIAPLKMVGSGLWGGTKLGASLGLQTALMPFRAAKYPLLLAAKPLVGFINLFRSNKWTPLPGIRDSIRNDAGRVIGYTKEKSTGVMKGTAETVTKTTAGEWGKVKFTDTKYADRNKHHAAERAEMMKVHEPKSDIDPIEVAESPFISLDKYNKQIEMVAKALGITIHAPSGHEVKVGHVEKADAHASDAHAKKDEHGADHSHGAEAHPPAAAAHHEEPKKAAGGHH